MTAVLVMAAAALAIFSLPGCGHKKLRDAPILSISDNAHIITPGTQFDLDRIATKVANSSLHFAVLTEAKIDYSLPTAAADRAFENYPGYPSDPTERKKRKEGEAFDGDKWEPTAVFICVSMSPRLIQVRLGPRLSKTIPEPVICRMLNKGPYQLLERNEASKAVAMAAYMIAAKAQWTGVETQKSGWLQAWADAGAGALRRVAYPTRAIYYHCAFNPLLNSLALLLSWFGGSTWVVVGWILLIRLILRHDILGQILAWVNLKLLVLTYPLWRGFLGKGDMAEQIAGSSNVISSYEMTFLTLGMGVPIFAVLALLIAPLQENMISVKAHLYHWVLPHVHFGNLWTLKGSFLWWHNPAAAAGTVIGICFCLLSYCGAIPEAILTFWIGQLSFDEAVAIGVPAPLYALDKMKSEAFAETNGKALLGIPVLAVGIANFPFLFSVYYLVGAIGSAFSGLRAFAFWWPRLTRNL
jgi:hypothetical protein